MYKKYKILYMISASCIKTIPDIKGNPVKFVLRFHLNVDGIYILQTFNIIEFNKKIMDKKELRKELEILLIHSIEDTLNKKDSTTTKKIRKTTFEVSKVIAKKFYKSIKTEATVVKGNRKTTPKKVVKTNSKPVAGKLKSKK